MPTNKVPSLRAPLRMLTLALLGVGLAGCLSGGGNDNDSASSDPDRPSANVQSGVVEGVELETGVHAFRGIRYAKAPTDDLRLAPPEPSAAITGTVTLSEAFGSGCPQIASSFGASSTNEDCLFLNVYKPAEPGPYPVMVWIHGGAFIAGSGGQDYEPSRLVEQGVVVVTLNYRLGALGFLPHAALSAEQNGSSGNYGLMDQQLALKWVKDNIAAFDGNPDNVTIFGESAGGHSVLSHLASEQSAGLFDKAIVQSGSYNGDQIPLAFGEAVVGAPFAAAAGCETDVAACLRRLSVDRILEVQGDSWYLPVTGSTTLPVSINAALQTHDFNQVPVIIGSNQNEGRLFVALDEIPKLQAAQRGEIPLSEVPLTDPDEYVQAVRTLLATDPRGVNADQVAQDYLAMQPVDDADRLSLAYAAIQTDWRFACPQVEHWDDLIETVPTWAYWFTDENAPSLFAGVPISFPLEAAHAFEIQYVLNSEETMRERGASDAQIALSERMLAYWSTFAKYGDPNTSDGTGNPWQPAEALTVHDLDAPAPADVSFDAFFDYHNCNYWDNPPRVLQ